MGNKPENLLGYGENLVPLTGTIHDGARPIELMSLIVTTGKELRMDHAKGIFGVTSRDANLRRAGHQRSHMAIVKALGKGPSRMTRHQRKQQRGGVVARHRLEKVQLYLGEIIKPVINDARKLLEIFSRGDLLGR